jgi:UDP-N-acetylmuramoyl-L-alanine---L-glutamate ligase
MTDQIIYALQDKSILILGFGKEGRSSLGFIQSRLPGAMLGIADRNSIPDEAELMANNPGLKVFTGNDYLRRLDDYDVVIKSPGIPLRLIQTNQAWITSQTDLFLQAFADKTIGITGTKGKSTTASLIQYLLEHLGLKSLLTGNIGLPCFDIISLIEPDTLIVFELSANQLEILHRSPHIAILLNIFEEHLDHFGSFEAYKSAKTNIFRFGTPDDYLICPQELINKAGLMPMQQLLPFHQIPDNLLVGIKGKHNRDNCGAALAALHAAGIDPANALSLLADFKGLSHRLEFVGNFEGIDFYNDSIATVPEATIAALETLNRVDFLILGGYDRGISYHLLADYLMAKPVRYLMLSGAAGERMAGLLAGQYNHHLVVIESLDDMMQVINQFAAKGDVCLLSPAASSYDRFKNFEHRGDHFKMLITKNYEQ